MLLINKSVLACAGFNALGLTVRSNSVVSHELNTSKLEKAKIESLFKFFIIFKFLNQNVNFKLTPYLLALTPLKYSKPEPLPTPRPAMLGSQLIPSGVL